MTKQQLAAISICLFLIGSAEVVAGPMMHFMGPHFGVASSAIAYLPAAYGLTYGFVALMAGPLSDRFGRKRPLQIGLLGFALLCALLPSSPNLSVAIGMSALSGLCAAIIQPNALALVADASTPDQVGRRLGHVFAGLMLAFVFTPMLAGRLADTVGWAWAYYALAVLALVICFAVTRGFASRPALVGQSVGFLATHRAALRTRGVALRLVASYLWLGWVAGFGAVVAEVGARKLSLSSTEAGLLAGFFGLVVILGNLVSGACQRMAGEFALPVAAMASAVGLTAFAMPSTSITQLALLGLPWAFGYGCAGPLHHARLSNLSTRCRGTINSYHASLLNLGIFSVAFLLGAIAPEGPLDRFCALVGITAFVGAALLLPWSSRKVRTI